MTWGCIVVLNSLILDYNAIRKGYSLYFVPDNRQMLANLLPIPMIFTDIKLFFLTFVYDATKHQILPYLIHTFITLFIFFNKI